MQQSTKTTASTERWTADDVLEYEAAWVTAARANFWAYRKYISPDLIEGWWQMEIARELELFFADLLAGRRPTIIFEAPPQHGKTVQVTDFVSWAAGKNPDLKTIYTSYSEDLGVAANSKLQRVFLSDKYGKVFPLTKAGRQGFAINSSLIEFADRQGSFRNTTVQGQVTGKGLHLGVIDDPIKGRFEADQEGTRNKTWNWMTDDFFTRFDENSGLLLMLTRWHLDDPAGRLMAAKPGARLLRYPAVAERDERHRKKGEALFPQLKSLEFLMERKAIMSQSAWESEYQQNPILVGGDMFKRHWFELVGASPSDCNWVRRWDLASTKDGGAYTAGVLMGHSRSEKKFYVADVRRSRLDGDGVKKLIMQTSALDMYTLGKRNYQVWLPQDPGQAGKVQAKDFINMLAGYDAHAELESGDKETRARPFAAQCEAGNVKLVRGDWVKSYLDELETFPAGKFKDQVDASSGAFGALIMFPKQTPRTGLVRE